MKKLFLFVFVLCLSPAAVFGQGAAHPLLHDISGMYSFLHDGESLQLTVDHGKLSGWVTSFGFLDSDRDTLLDRFFEKASLQGNHLYFLSRRIHGCWVEFNGRIDHGEGRQRGQEGYYVLVGTLTQYTSDAEVRVSARQREVTLKSAFNPDLAER
jgi:hypothetical protein